MIGKATVNRKNSPLGLLLDASRRACLVAALAATADTLAAPAGLPPGAIAEPKPGALTRGQTRKLHASCLSPSARHASFDACTALIQSGQLPARDVARYLERRAFICAQREDRACTMADLQAAERQVPDRAQHLRRLQTCYASERDAETCRGLQ